MIKQIESIYLILPKYTPHKNATAAKLRVIIGKHCYKAS